MTSQNQLKNYYFRFRWIQLYQLPAHLLFPFKSSMQLLSLCTCGQFFAQLLNVSDKWNNNLECKTTTTPSPFFKDKFLYIVDAGQCMIILE